MDPTLLTLARSRSFVTSHALDASLFGLNMSRTMRRSNSDPMVFESDDDDDNGSFSGPVSARSRLEMLQEMRNYVSQRNFFGTDEPLETSTGNWNHVIKASKEKETYRAIRQLAAASLVLCVVALLGMILQNELLFHNGFQVSLACFLVQLVSSVATAALLLSIYLYYLKHLVLLKLRHLVPENEWLCFSSFFPNFLTEMVVLSLHTPPIGVPGTRVSPFVVTIENAVSLLMFLRVYLVVRLIRDNSTLFSQAARFIGLMTHIELSNTYILKSVMNEHPYRTLLVSFGGIVSYMSYIIHICERIDNADHVDFRNSVWHMLVTMATVGYGDISVDTDLGRIVSVGAAFYGVMLTALVVAVVHREMLLTVQERTVVDFMQKDKFRSKRTDLAARAIQAGWRYYRTCRSFPRKNLLVSQAERHLYSVLRGFREQKRLFVAVNTNGSEYHLMDMMYFEMLEMRSEMEWMREYLKRALRNRRRKGEAKGLDPAGAHKGSDKHRGHLMPIAPPLGDAPLLDHQGAWLVPPNGLGHVPSVLLGNDPDLNVDPSSDKEEAIPTKELDVGQQLSAIMEHLTAQSEMMSTVLTRVHSLEETLGSHDEDSDVSTVQSLQDWKLMRLGSLPAACRSNPLGGSNRSVGSQPSLEQRSAGSQQSMQRSAVAVVSRRPRRFSMAATTHRPTLDDIEQWKQEALASDGTQSLPKRAGQRSYNSLGSPSKHSLSSGPD